MRAKERTSSQTVWETSHPLINLKLTDNEDYLRILHVDDDVCFLEVSKQILEMEGKFEIDNATSVDEAFQKLGKQSYDAVVSDYEMPQKDGLQFLKELREQKNNIPFVLFTGKGREEVAIKTLNLGADGYHNKQGSPETVYGELSHSISLIVDRNKAKHALVESEKRYRTIMEQAADVILIHDKSGRIIDANAAAIKKLGYTRKELLSMSITDISPTATESIIHNLWPKIIAGQTITLESYHKHKSGNIIPVEVTIGPLTVDKEIQIIGLVRDVTERKKAEEQIRKAAEEWKKTFDAISDFVFVLDKEHRFTAANKALSDFLRKEPKELIGKRCYEVLHGTDAPVLDCPCAKAKVTRKPEAIETVDAHSGLCFLLSVWPFFDENGEYAGCVHIAKDITERKKTEED